MNNKEHPLHEKIGQLISKDRFPGVIKDPACSGSQNIPLFCIVGSEDKSNENEYCNVDLLIVVEDKIKIIMEIEESDFTPTHIFGKFLTSALSTHHIHNSKSIPKDSRVLFIQMIDTSKLEENSSKREQWKRIEKSIKDIISAAGIKIKISDYKLFFGNADEYEMGSTKAKELTDFIEKFRRDE